MISKQLGRAWTTASTPGRRHRDYLQSGQQPVPIKWVAADAPVAATATRTAVSARIVRFIGSSPLARDRAGRRFIRRFLRVRGAFDSRVKCQVGA